MTATEMVATVLGAKPDGIQTGDCGLCGAIALGAPFCTVLKPTFTNEDELHSAHICWACAFCLSDRRVRSSFLVTDSFHRLMRSDVWTTLLSPPPPPFVLYLTRQGKKHGIFRQIVAMNRDRFRVVCEDLIADFHSATDRQWMYAAAKLVLAGARRTSVETGRYTSADYQRTGFTELRTLEARIEAVRGSHLWTIVIGLMPAKKDIKEDIWTH